MFPWQRWTRLCHPGCHGLVNAQGEGRFWPKESVPVLSPGSFLKRVKENDQEGQRKVLGSAAALPARCPQSCTVSSAPEPARRGPSPRPQGRASVAETSVLVKGFS